MGTFTAGHETHNDVLGFDCPVCGCRRLHWQRGFGEPDQTTAQWGVMLDEAGAIDLYEDEADARAFQARHGGELLIVETRTTVVDSAGPQ